MPAISTQQLELLYDVSRSLHSRIELSQRCQCRKNSRNT